MIGTGKEEKIKTNSQTTHFLYSEKPTQQSHTAAHTHPRPRRNLRRMNHKCVQKYSHINTLVHH